MQTPFPLLAAVGQAVLDALDAGFLSDAAVRADTSFADNVWQRWITATAELGRHDEVARLLHAGADELDNATAAIAGSLTVQQPVERRNVVADYLRNVRATIRRHLRRPSDPTGQTLPPHWMLRQASDLLPLLPARLPWFGSGDRPHGAGDWELVELVEVGGWGEAWKARRPGEAGTLAELHFVQPPGVKEALLRLEPPLLERVQGLNAQPGWLALQNTYVNADPPCLEYAWFEAGDLGGCVREWSDQQPTVTEVQTLVRALALTLVTAHRLEPPLVHRGLSPGNIRVARADDGSWQCRIVHLGLAEVVETAGEGLGPASAYASPQQVRGEPARPWDDVYALGVLWYQMLTGDLTAGRPGGSQWRRRLADRGVAPAVVELLESCFEDEPRYRPADAGVLAAQLEAMTQAPAPAARRTVDLAALLPIAPAAESAAPREPAAGTGGPSRQRTRRADVRQLFETLQEEKKEQAKLLTNAIGMKLVLIQPGIFLMGSPETEAGRRENEGPQHEVHLQNAFYMSVHPVTQANFLQVMNHNPARCKLERGGGPDHPVENVTWDQAVEFCRRLSELAEEKAAGRVYRLPTEAEWEYACRAGTTTAFSFGSALSADQANFDGTFPYGDAPRGLYAEKTTPVGSYPANNFGLHDMHGNVWEWCADWHDSDTYARSPRRNPKGPAEGQFRVVRGGSWRNHAASCRSAYRNGMGPRSRDGCTGFRVVVEVE
jgi:formylglycine-generating enzyme required for sulfatase activity